MSGETGLVKSESGRPQWVARVNRSAREGGKGREVVGREGEGGRGREKGRGGREREGERGRKGRDGGSNRGKERKGDVFIYARLFNL